MQKNRRDLISQLQLKQGDICVALDKHIVDKHLARPILIMDIDDKGNLKYYPCGSIEKNYQRHGFFAGKVVPNVWYYLFDYNNYNNAHILPFVINTKHTTLKLPTYVNIAELYSTTIDAIEMDMRCLGNITESNLEKIINLTEHEKDFYLPADLRIKMPQEIIDATIRFRDKKRREYMTKNVRTYLGDNDKG